MRYYSSTATPKTLDSSITSIDTTATVNNVTGLPNPSYPYTLVFDPDTAFEEIVSVTGASGNTLTIVRAQDGTAATSHGAGAVVKHMVTARDLQEPQNHMNASSGVHGVTGSVVGTTDTQTLTNKTLGSGSVVPQSAVTNLISDLALKAPLASPNFTGTVSLPGTTSIGTVSSAELGYLDGVTSAIQTQLNAKAPSASPTLTGAVDASGATSVSLPTNTSVGSVSSTELGYLDGVTSAVQTQLNSLIGGSAGRACMVYANTVLTSLSTANTWYAVQFDTEVLDTVAWWSSGNNTRVTPTVAGYYLVFGSVYGLGSASGVSRYAAVRKNGSTFVVGSANRMTEPSGTFQGAALNIQTNPVVVYMNGTTDYVELMGRSDQGSQETAASNSDGQANALTLLKVA